MKCPYRVFGLGNCLEKNCPRWVTMSENKEVNGKIETKTVGKCSDAWLPLLQTELIWPVKRIMEIIQKK